VKVAAVEELEREAELRAEIMSEPKSLEQEIRELVVNRPEVPLTPALGKPTVNPIPVAQLEGRRIEELSDSEKIDCARQFFLTGNLSAIARDHRISYNDLLDMARAPWWAEEVRNLEREANAQLKVRLTKMLGKTIDQLEERLDHGDVVWRDKGLRVVPICARDLAAIASSVFDKKKLIEEAESGFGTSEGKRLMALAEALKFRAGETFEAEMVGSPGEAPVSIHGTEDQEAQDDQI